MPNSAHDREHDHQLFAEFSALSEDDPKKLAIRAELISDHLALVNHIARKFINRGEPLEDLIQVGTIGLIKAIDRFEPEKGFEFSTFAMPTIVGEIKRHFRDKTWAVRVPRRLQELGASVTKAATELSQQLDRSPTIAEIAEHLNVDLDEVVEAMNANAAHSTVSLDATLDPDAPSIGSRFGSIDEALEGVEYRESLKPLLLALPEREKDILVMRFFENKSQTEIARTLGISQMHVSRILGQTLAKLRTSLQD
ncbi:MAG: RNA polymerase sigma factor SigF [Actinomycetales bacterium]|nr:RNA polymerase sigma factor SigF [Actinomycetales bacterium]